MRLDRLKEPPAPAATPEPQEARIEVEGGVVHLLYLPAPRDAEKLPVEELLGQHLVGWNVERDDQPAPINADVIHALSVEVKGAFRETILGRGQAKPSRVATGEEKAAEERPRARAGTEEKKKDE